jgi:DNA-binding CsgD family transcriptional regulator
MFAQQSYSSTALAIAPNPGANEGLHCLARALDEINEGAIFLNSDGQLVWHNRAFDKLMVDNREGHLLVASVIELADDFRRAPGLGETRNGASALMEELVSSTAKIGGISHELHCALMPKGMLGADSFLLCLVKRSASRWSSYEQHLRRTWNLTEREAQVAVECLQGKKNLEIAEQLRISVETVNKHLDKVYQKAGVRGRAELASRLLDSSV